MRKKKTPAVPHAPASRLLQDTHVHAETHHADMSWTSALRHLRPNTTRRIELSTEASGRPRAKKKTPRHWEPPTPPRLKVVQHLHRGTAVRFKHLRSATRPATLNCGVRGLGCAVLAAGVFFFALTGTSALAFFVPVKFSRRPSSPVIPDRKSVV